MSQVCPDKLKESYEVYYARGRVVYLRGEVLKRNTRLVAIDREIAESRPEGS